MVDFHGGCSEPGLASDRAADLRRRAAIAHDLFDRVTAVRRTLPQWGDREGWRGPAADLFTAAVVEQHDRLGREVARLDNVRTLLRAAATQADAEALALGGMP